MDCRYWVTLGSLHDIRQVNAINPNLTFGLELLKSARAWPSKKNKAETDSALIR